MSPPNTVNALNVAADGALEPTAIAAVPMTTLGRYSSDSAVRLNWPTNVSVMPNNFVHGAPMQHQRRCDDGARQRQQRQHADRRRPHAVGQPGWQAQPHRQSASGFRAHPIRAPSPCTPATQRRKHPVRSESASR